MLRLQVRTGRHGDVVRDLSHSHRSCRCHCRLRADHNLLCLLLLSLLLLLLLLLNTHGRADSRWRGGWRHGSLSRSHVALECSTSTQSSLHCCHHLCTHTQFTHNPAGVARRVGRKEGGHPSFSRSCLFFTPSPSLSKCLHRPPCAAALGRAAGRARGPGDARSWRDIPYSPEKHRVVA